MSDRARAAAETSGAKIQQERQSRRRFFFLLQGELLFSPAFNKISSFGPAVTALLHVIARQPLPPKKKEQERLRKARLWPPKPAEFSFPIREARHHGLTEKGLAEGLLRLHEVGFIDRLHPGSARRGDFARYVFSERWKKYGRDDFEHIEWPKAIAVGRNDRGNTGRFLPTRIGKRSVPTSKPFVAAISTATKEQRMAKYAATNSL